MTKKQREALENEVEAALSGPYPLTWQGIAAFLQQRRQYGAPATKRSELSSTLQRLRRAGRITFDGAWRRTK